MLSENCHNFVSLLTVHTQKVVNSIHCPLTLSFSCIAAKFVFMCVLLVHYISFTIYIYPRHFMVFLCSLLCSIVYLLTGTRHHSLIEHVVFDWRLPQFTITTQTSNVFQKNHLSLRCCVSTVHRFFPSVRNSSSVTQSVQSVKSTMTTGAFV